MSCSGSDLNFMDALVAAQILQSAERKRMDVESLNGARTAGPPQGEGKEADDQRYAWEHTWDMSNFSSMPQLAEELARETRLVDSMRAKVKERTDKMLAASPGIQTGLLSSCAMHRISPSLFPARPVVSFMLQVEFYGMLGAHLSKSSCCATFCGIAHPFLACALHAL